MNISNFLKLIRLENLIMVVLVMWLVEHILVVPLLQQSLFVSLLPWYVEYMLILSVVFIAAAGYAINDYFDTKIDAINRPDKQLVGTIIPKNTAMLVHNVMTGIGVVLGLIVAILLRSWTIAIIIIFAPGVLWFYSASYKRQFLLGNLMVALMCGLCPLIVAIANVAAFKMQFPAIVSYSTIITDIYKAVGIYSLFAFIFTLIREIEKTMQDQNGDREMECHTLPIVLGDMWTKIIVTLLVVLTIVALFYVDFRVLADGGRWSSPSTRFICFGILIPLLCNLALLWTAKIPSDYRSAQILMKVAMSIAAFAPLFCRL